MVGQSRFICLRSNLLQVKMFLNDRNWNNSIQILLHYKHVPSIMDWESVVVNCGKYQLLARMPKSREILLLSNLILATWYLILLDLQKIPTSSHRSLYNCTSDPSVSNVTRLEGAIREAAGRQGHLNAKGPRMLAASWKKISFAGNEILKYHGLSISYCRSHMINLWVICDFTSIHTSQWKQINVSLGCPLILRIKLPTGRRRKSRNACRSWSDV